MWRTRRRRTFFEGIEHHSLEHGAGHLAHFQRGPAALGLVRGRRRLELSLLLDNFSSTDALSINVSSTDALSINS